MLCSSQIRAARAMLNWKQLDLARASGVAESTVKLVERDAVDTRSGTLEKLQIAFEKAGVQFIPDGSPSLSGGPGVRLNRQR
jgi:transcriptional regulator with XRE-family HTH domain